MKIVSTPEILKPTLLAYLADCLRILGTSLERYHEGHSESYRVAAVQLRILLCDTTRIRGEITDISLAARLYPDLLLHTLRQDEYGPLQAASGEPDLTRLAWLAQPVYLAESSEMTVRDIIRQVCDRDGGAHVDPAAAMPDMRDLVVQVGEYAHRLFSSLMILPEMGSNHD